MKASPVVTVIMTFLGHVLSACPAQITTIFVDTVKLRVFIQSHTVSRKKSKEGI